jgi:hypothetical protein
MSSTELDYQHSSKKQRCLVDAGCGMQDAGRIEETKQKQVSK